ncbi:MAG: right-handed parallel beta-helix repeat-containing protein [Chthoniobacterales bacterium]
MKTSLTFLFCIVFGLASAKASSGLIVDANASEGGDGSKGSPFKTISEALAVVAPGGATITIKGGTYREAVTITKEKSGVEDSPLILRAAPGETVIVTGFDRLEGWKDEGGGLYSLETSERVGDLFVDAQRQRLARFPEADQPWIRILSGDESSGQIALESTPDLSAEDLKDVYTLIYSKAINGELTYPVTSLDAAGKTIVATPKRGRFLPKEGDALIFLNAAKFVTEPGEWSCQPAGSGWRVLFRPKSPDDLKNTQTRRRQQAIRAVGSCVVLEGLEIAGGITYGVYASNTDNLQIKNCLIYANGSTGVVSGYGLRIDNCTNFTLDSSIIFGNYVNGIGFSQGENILVRGCEITANDGDGIVFAGRNNQPDAPLKNVRLENCYIHRHFYLAHPDNSQIHSNVQGVTYENNILFLAGQSVMIEKCEDMKFHNNIFFGVTARHVILGHGSSKQADFKNNTFAFSNYGSIGTAAEGVTLEENVFYQSVLSYESEDVKGDKNLFWSLGDGDKILVHTIPKWKGYAEPQEFAIDHESEANSKLEDPDFKNVPLLQVIGSSSFFAGARDTIFMKDSSIDKFGVGDTIEINADGVARKIKSVGTESITFSPELPTLPFREAFIWKWGQSTNLQINLSSTLVGHEGQPGANLDFSAYQRGELDGSGKRSIPELSPTAKAAMPSSDNFIYPFCLPVEN